MNTVFTYLLSVLLIYAYGLIDSCAMFPVVAPNVLAYCKKVTIFTNKTTGTRSTEWVVK